MAVFFTSDTHFGDHRTLNIGRRPFADVASMDAEMEARWNAAVTPDDEVWHLGDFARGRAHAERVFPRLHGRKHLIVGNNDGPATLALPWLSVEPYRELRLEGVDLVLCHYAFRSWNRQPASLNLHGHSHGRLKPSAPRQLDVGVDPNDYRPLSLAQVLAKLLPRRAA